MAHMAYMVRMALHDTRLTLIGIYIYIYLALVPSVSSHLYIYCNIINYMHLRLAVLPLQKKKYLLTPVVSRESFTIYLLGKKSGVVV